MASTLHTLGLRVDKATPSMYSVNINVNSEIKIMFNSELNTDTLPNNFFILKDVDRNYIRGNVIKVEDYEEVPGTASYKDKTIIFTPSNQLEESTRYIIYVKKNKVADILGNVMLTDFISYFDTEDSASFDLPIILEPENNSIVDGLNKVSIEDVGGYRYVYQISKQPTFENIIKEEIVDGTELERDFELGDGLYYIRARVEDGEFGVANVFSVRTYKSTTVTDDDISDQFIYEPYDEKELELIASYPENEAVMVNIKTNVYYMKFNSIVPIEDIDFTEAVFEGNYSDEDDQFNDDLEVKAQYHGEVDGSFSVVYDEENEETYVFFIPTNL